MSERGLFRDGLITVSALPEAILTKERPFFESLSVARDKRYSRLTRARAAVNLAGTAIPGLEEYLTRFFAADQVPIQSAELTHCGGVHTVFTNEQKTHALKIDRFSLGMSPEEIRQYTLEKQEKYERLRGMFDEPDIVIPTSFLIVHSQIQNRPASAMVQHYLPNLRDLFFDFTPAELAAELRNNEKLRKQFDTFNRVKDDIEYDGEKWSIDYMGKGNITVTSKGTMAIVDPDMLTKSYLHGHPSRMTLIQKRRDFLAEVEKGVQSCESAGTRTQNQ